MSSEEEAQDLTSDVFLRAWQYLLDESGKDVRHLSALLYGIARNRVIDFYRSRAAKETVPLADEAEDTLADGHRQDKQTEAKIDVELLGRQMRSLKDEYREVLVMRYLDEMSISEIAAVLDKPAGNVRVLVHRALEALKKHVEQEPRERTEEVEHDARRGNP